MKPVKVGVLSLLGLTTVLVITYNACSVRRYDTANVNGGQNSSSTGNPNGQQPNSFPNPVPNPQGTDVNYFVQNGIMKLTAAGKMQNLALNGRMMMVRTNPSGRTDVYVHLSGLTPATKYDVHLHNQSCQLGGGSHYKIDPKVASTLEDNEIWPTVNTGADGSGSGFKSTSHSVRSEGQSIVLHGADGARLACGDLGPQASISYKSGRFSTLPAGLTQGLNIQGAAVIVRNPPANQTIVRARVAGLAANTTYSAHVHNSACNVSEGGSHYKMNPNVTEAAASTANELWLSFTTNATGSAEARIEADHVARTDAASIVIHDPANSANRLACVDLNVDGGFLTTEAGFQKGYNVIGMGSLERQPNGTTVATVSVSGLRPNLNYVPHVHDRPCHVNMGGGHYKIDPSATTTAESNEIWLRFTSDAQGSGNGSISIPHLARPEAQSIVIHDPADPTARVACMDIY